MSLSTGPVAGLGGQGGALALLLCLLLGAEQFHSVSATGFMAGAAGGLTGGSAEAGRVGKGRDSRLVAAWKAGKYKDVWQGLHTELTSELGAKRAEAFSAPVVPATLAYLLSAYHEDVLGPRRRGSSEGRKPLNIHLIGATYAFEGMSDWRWLAKALPPDVDEVRVDLILGTPFQIDGVSLARNGRAIDFDLPERDQVPVLLQRATVERRVTAAARHSNPLSAKDVRLRACRRHTYGTVKVDVRCQEHLYLNVAHRLPRPDLALMINPGFPLPNRRSFDGVLRHLLAARIPTAVSAQQTPEQFARQRHSSPALLEQEGGTERRGQQLSLQRDFDDEAFQTLQTLKHYRARLLGVTGSPFLYHSWMGDQEEQDGTQLVKNAVLHVFKGREVGAPPIRMATQSEGGADQEIKRIGDNADAVQLTELLAALRSPVSTSFEAAAQEWARAKGLRLKDARGGAPEGVVPMSVGDWLHACVKSVTDSHSC